MTTVADLADMLNNAAPSLWLHFAVGRTNDGRWQASYRADQNGGYAVGMDADLEVAINKMFTEYDQTEKKFVNVGTRVRQRVRRPTVPDRKVKREDDDII